MSIFLYCTYVQVLHSKLFNIGIPMLTNLLYLFDQFVVGVNYLLSYMGNNIYTYSSKKRYVNLLELNGFNLSSNVI